MEQQLSALFHRHAAVTPEAWVAYGEMCGLARDAYGLDVALPYIPPQPQDDGAGTHLSLDPSPAEVSALRSTSANASLKLLVGITGQAERACIDHLLQTAQTPASDRD